jgi:penicillin-binding protein 1A
MIDDKAPPNKRLRRGAIIRVQTDEKNNWRIVQMPEVEAAFLAADPRDGAVRALVGGFDFNRNKFNHVTQAWRQPGSSFKPFIYSGALERASPRRRWSTTNRSASRRRSPAARPGNRRTTTASTKGRCACVPRWPSRRTWSRSVFCRRAACALCRTTSPALALTPARHPPYLTMALGAGSVTPWEMVTAYAVFANGGYRIRPYIVQRDPGRQEAGAGAAAPNLITAGDEQPARDRPAQRLPDGQHATRRDHLRNRCASFGNAQAPRSGRQDGNHQ